MLHPLSIFLIPTFSSQSLCILPTFFLPNTTIGVQGGGVRWLTDGRRPTPRGWQGCSSMCSLPQRPAPMGRLGHSGACNCHGHAPAWHGMTWHDTGTRHNCHGRRLHVHGTTVLERHRSTVFPPWAVSEASPCSLAGTRAPCCRPRLRAAHTGRDKGYGPGW
jgi:hypothetical protein